MAHDLFLDKMHYIQMIEDLQSRTYTQDSMVTKIITNGCHGNKAWQQRQTTITVYKYLGYIG